MQRVHVIQDFPQPVEEVFAYLSEQENLAPLFGAKIKRLSDGSDGTRNGVGASREPAFKQAASRCHFGALLSGGQRTPAP
jgi:hypothetical protein